MGCYNKVLYFLDSFSVINNKIVIKSIVNDINDMLRKE